MTCSRSRNPPNTDGSTDHYAPQAGPALSRKKPTQIGNTKNPFAMNTLKTIFTFFFTLCFMMVANGYAQKTDSINTEAGKSVLHRNAVYLPPALEEYADTTLLHQRFIVENKGNYLYTPFTEDNEPTIPFNYGFLHPLGERFYNCFMGKVDRILRPKADKGFIILTSYLVVLGDSYAFDTSNKDTSKLADLKYLDFRHIKRDFSYGHPYQGFTPNDRIELSNFVQSYGRKAALETANAWVMASYPFSLQSTKFENLYTRGRKLILTDGKTTLYLYFLMIDSVALNFDTEVLPYIKGVFRFNRFW